MNKKARNSLFPQCKTSIGNNCGSIKESCEVNAWGVQHGVFVTRVDHT